MKQNIWYILLRETFVCVSDFLCMCMTFCFFGFPNKVFNDDRIYEYSSAAYNNIFVNYLSIWHVHELIGCQKHERARHRILMCLSTSPSYKFVYLCCISLQTLSLRNKVGRFFFFLSFSSGRNRVECMWHMYEERTCCSQHSLHTKESHHLVASPSLLIIRLLIYIKILSNNKISIYVCFYSATKGIFLYVFIFIMHDCAS